MEITRIVLTGVVAGLIGAVIMNLFLRWVSASFDEPVNMVKALGSFITRSLENAVLVGTVFHLTFGAIFGTLYSALLHSMQANGLPVALFTGFGFGFVHGLFNSYLMMFVMGESHPIEKYRRSTFSIGVLYLIAHVIYGGVVGVLIGLLSYL